jgi:hypothetical protein
MAVDVTRYPISDYYTTSWVREGGSGTDLYTSIDDPAGSPDDNTTYIIGPNASTGLWGYNSPDVPAGATVNYVRVYSRIAGGNNNGSYGERSVRVNGSLYYGSADISADWTTNYTSWTTNPNTSSAWTVDDVNGTGSHPLQHIGMRPTQGFYFDGKTFYYYNISTTQLYLVVNYTEAAAVGYSDPSGPGKIASPSSWSYIL